MAKRKQDKSKTKKSRRKGKTLAAKADKYKLYQAAVQEPEVEVDFFKKAYRRQFKRKPRLLREDFCAAAAVCAEWVKDSKKHVAYGVDIAPEPLAWGEANNLAPLTKAQRSRVRLVQQDVRDIQGPKADVIAGQNFSYFIFDTRPALREYFTAAYENLASEGILVLDMMGGPEVLHEDSQDKRKIAGGATYVWDQHRFDPISHDCTFFIHFRFRDGSELKRAFRYDWRLWSIPEVRELLEEAGFSKSIVYWEGTDENGEGDGEYRPRKTAPSDPAWIAYLVAVKK